MLKVAIVGLGKMGQRHAHAWKKIADTEIVGIVGRNEAKLQLQAEHLETNYYTEISQLLKEQKVDVIDICLSTFLHYETIKAIADIDENIAIICEKPLCLDEQEADKILQLRKEKGVNIFVGHTLRFDPEYMALHEQVSQGAAGKVGVVRMERKTVAPGGWFKDYHKSGGILMDLGIHDLDWLLWTFGPCERVMARTIKQSVDLDFDYALVTIRMKNGVIAHLELSWGADQLQSSVEIAGTEGMLVTNSRENNPIQIHTKEVDLSKNYLPADFIGESPVMAQLKHFKNCITHGEKPRITVEEAIQAVKLARATIHSIQQKNVIYMEEEGLA